MSEPENFSLAFDLIRRYAEREGWIPVGVRKWTVGPWTIHVNGSGEPVGHILPWHALISHETIMAMALINPLGGSVAGWVGMEDEFIAAMTAELGEQTRRRA